MTISTASRTPYVQPTGDEPLTPIEKALIRALGSIILQELREEAAADAQADAEKARSFFPGDSDRG